jgi:hypothetical protein
MLILSNTSSIIRLITSAAGDIEVDAGYVDFTSPSTYAPDGVITASITTATTTTIVSSPAGSAKRNVRTINITNNSTSVSNIVTVEKFDGTNAAELISFVLLAGENMVLNQNGNWQHTDANGAVYPPVGLGQYNGRSVDFMKITTASDAAGYWYCSSKDAGFPGAWSPGAPGINGRITDGTSAADNGCLVIANPSAGANFISEIDIVSSVNHTHLFFDVLWVNTGLVITTTTAQAITVPTLPARDINGSTAGEGLSIGLLCTSAVGLAAVASNATVTYVNSAGVGGRTATLSAIVGSQAPATPVIGTIIWFNLAAGDKGVQGGSWSVTLNTSWVSGTISLFIARPIAQIGTAIPNVSANKKPSAPGIRSYNSSCILHGILSGATTATFISADISVVEK